MCQPVDALEGGREFFSLLPFTLEGGRLTLKREGQGEELERKRMFLAAPRTGQWFLQQGWCLWLVWWEGYQLPV